MSEEREEIIIPVITEHLAVRTRRRTTGVVRITKRVREEVQEVRPLRLRDTIEVVRVPVNRQVTEPPQSRQEGDTTIIPIVEEVLVIEKRLVLREEIHVIRRREEVEEPHRVTLRREEADVQRLGPQD